MDVEDAIVEAGKARKTIEFDYVSAKGESSHREVEPYSFTEKQDTMLYAYDLTKEDTRMFSLSGMSNVVITDRSFVPKWTVEF